MKTIKWQWSKITTVTLVVVILIFAGKMVLEILNRRSLNQELGSLNEQITNLQSKQQELEQLMTYLESSDFIEKEARTRLNLRKDGERVIIIPATGSAPVLGQNQTITTSTTEQLSNVQKWWQYIFPYKKFTND